MKTKQKKNGQYCKICNLKIPYKAIEPHHYDILECVIDLKSNIKRLRNESRKWSGYWSHTIKLSKDKSKKGTEKLLTYIEKVEKIKTNKPR